MRPYGCGSRLFRGTIARNARELSRDRVLAQALELEVQVNVVYSSLPVSKEQIDRIGKETQGVPVLRAVMKCILVGWREGDCLAYSHYRDELSTVNGIILKGSRIVIPVSLRAEMLDVVHVGHLGSEKQKRSARDVMFWPCMNRDIDLKIQGCGVCQKYRPAQQKETLMEGDNRDDLGPWDKVGLDLFVWDKHDYLIAIDYYSNFPEIARLNNTSSETIITHLKSFFLQAWDTKEGCK